MLKTLCLAVVYFAVSVGTAIAQDCSGVDPKASTPLASFNLPASHTCTQRMKNGFPIPDPSCTPGVINKTVTLSVLKRPAFKTACIRDKASSAHAKAVTYDWYYVQHPVNNTGSHQTCELDHLVSLELGGADTLDNIWPQCGPPGVALNDRFFKMKEIGRASCRERV